MHLSVLSCFSFFVAYILADLSDSTISITTLPTVAAGTPFKATVNVKWYGLADSSYAYAFRIYLATSYTDKTYYWYHPECYLVKEQSLCDETIEVASQFINLNGTSISVTVPPTVGPSGRHYTLIGRILNTDGTYYGATWESDVFELTGANGTWAEYQKQGHQLWGDDGMSCTGFDCVKACVGASTHGQSVAFNSTYGACANACPDVDIIATSTRGGQATAERTEPSSCSVVHSSATGRSTFPTGTTSAIPARSSSTRTAVAAAATGEASLHIQSNMVSLIASFLIIAVAAC